MDSLTNDPMKNDLILERIFWFCDVPSLKNIRLVSRKWRDLSLKSWRDQAVLSTGSDCFQKLHFEDFLNLFLESEDKDPLQLKKYPFKSYSIEFDTFYREEYWEQKHIAVAMFNSRVRLVKILWKAYYFAGLNEFLSALNSDSLEVLEVSWHSLDRDIPETIQPLKCSKLKRLKLHTEWLSATHSPARSLWSYLLKSFQNLEALSVGYGWDKEHEHADYSICLTDRLKIVNLLKDLRQSGGESVMPLKELEMMDVYTNQNVYEAESKEYDIIKALAECKFPLEKLSIHAGWHGGGNNDDDKIPLLPLLKSCKETLQYLKASINFNSEFYDYPYVDEEQNCDRNFANLKTSKSSKICMEQLREVRLLNGLEWAMFLLAHLKVPQLEKLIVEYEKERNPYRDDRYGRVSVFFPRGRVYERLRTFELHDNPNIPDGKIIWKFAKMMPNLVHLTIPLDKKTFPLICLKFKGLRSLHILGAQSDYVEIDDEAFTGLSKAQLAKGGVPSASRRPNVADLEHLSDLSICCQRQLRRDDVKFTEHSVMHGFLQLPRLYNVSVAIKGMSAEMKEKLLSHVKGGVDFQRKQKPPGSSFVVKIVSDDDSSGMEDGQN